MATKVLGNTAICKLIIEKEDGKENYYLARGCKRFHLYNGELSIEAKLKALMYMGPHENDNTVEHWVAGKWQTSPKE
jgi:hypothetical protein